LYGSASTEDSLQYNVMKTKCSSSKELKEQLLHIFMMLNSQPGSTYHTILNKVGEHEYDFTLLLPDHAPEVCHSGGQWSLTCDVILACIFGALKLLETKEYLQHA